MHTAPFPLLMMNSSICIHLNGCPLVDSLRNELKRGRFSDWFTKWKWRMNRKWIKRKGNRKWCGGRGWGGGGVGCQSGCERIDGWAQSACAKYVHRRLLALHPISRRRIAADATHPHFRSRPPPLLSSFPFVNPLHPVLPVLPLLRHERLLQRLPASSYFRRQ